MNEVIIKIAMLCTLAVENLVEPGTEINMIENFCYHSGPAIYYKECESAMKSCTCSHVHRIEDLNQKKLRENFYWCEDLIL